jgi:hypothetical protein
MKGCFTGVCNKPKTSVETNGIRSYRAYRSMARIEKTVKKSGKLPHTQYPLQLATKRPPAKDTLFRP